MKPDIWTSSEQKREQLIAYADELVKIKKVPLQNTGIELIYGETHAENFGELKFLAEYLARPCNRIIILTSCDEYANLIVSKSSNVSHISASDIIETIAETYNGTIISSHDSVAALMHYWHDILPEMLDLAVEFSIVKTFA